MFLFLIVQDFPLTFRFLLILVSILSFLLLFFWFLCNLANSLLSLFFLFLLFTKFDQILPKFLVFEWIFYLLFCESLKQVKSFELMPFKEYSECFFNKVDPFL